MGDQSSTFGDLLGTVGTHLGNFSGMVGLGDKAVSAALDVPTMKGPGMLGGAGNMLSGFGKLAGGQAPQGLMEVAGGAMDVIATEATDDPWLGAIGPLLRGASAGVSVYQNADQCSADAPMADNACYTALGDAAFAGAELAFPGAGTVAKWGLDTLGGLAGLVNEDWGFSSGSAAGAVMHGGVRGIDAAAPYIDRLFPPAIEFSPTNVPMTVPPPTGGMRDQDSILEEIEASTDPTWASPYRR